MPVSDMLLTGVGKGYVLGSATSLWQAKNYSGSGAWLDEIGSADFQFGSTSGSDTNDPLWLPHSTSQNPFGAGVDYMYVPGLASNYVSTPDTAALDITGDITILARVCATDWTPSAIMAVGGKYTASGNQGSYWFYINTDGTLQIGTTTDGSTVITGISTAATGFTNGTAHWVAVTLDVNDGSGNRVYKFWTSDTDTNDPDSATWSQLGSTVTTAGTTSIYSGTSIVTVGNILGTVDRTLTGSESRFQIYSGVRDFSGTPSGGTLVADFNPAGGTISSTHSTLTGTGDGLTWTFNRSSTGRKLAVVDEDKFLLGTDDYFETPNNSNFNFGTGDFTAIITVRAFSTVPATNFYYLIKRVSTSNLEGWGLGDSAVSGNDFFFADGPSTSDQDLSYVGAFSSGLRKVYSGVRDSSNLTSYSNTTAGTPVTNSSRNVDNTSVLRIGYWSYSGNRFADCEIIAAAIFKDKALTAAEVAQVVSELA